MDKVVVDNEIFPSVFINNLCNFNKKYKSFLKKGLFNINNYDHDELLYNIIADFEKLIKERCYDFKPTHIFSILDYIKYYFDNHEDIFLFISVEGICIDEAFVMYDKLIFSLEKKYKDVIYDDDGKIDTDNVYLCRWLLNNFTYNENLFNKFDFLTYSKNDCFKDFKEYDFLLEHYKGNALIKVLNSHENYNYIGFFTYLYEEHLFSKIDSIILLKLFKIAIDKSKGFGNFYHTKPHLTISIIHNCLENIHTTDINILYDILSNVELFYAMGDINNWNYIDLGDIDVLTELLLTVCKNGDIFIKNHLDKCKVSIDYIVYLLELFEINEISLPTNSKALYKLIETNSVCDEDLRNSIAKTKDTFLKVFSKEELFDLSYC